MFPRTLDHNAKKALASLNNQLFLEPFLLSGGTALALQLGHRISYDLDFITNNQFIEQQVLNSLQQTKGFELKEQGWQTVHGTLFKTKISFLYQKGNFLEKPVEYQNIKLASVNDIAAMKLAAVSVRGVKRDFIDLYFICKSKKYSISDLINLYKSKYQTNGSTEVHVKKSLLYFDDAELDTQETKLLKKVDWEKVKEHFKQQVKNSNQTI